MSDIKLFSVETGAVTELAGQSVEVEKSLQNKRFQPSPSVVG